MQRNSALGVSSHEALTAIGIVGVTCHGVDKRFEQARMAMNAGWLRDDNASGASPRPGTAH
jgi:hypothetical protein